MSNFGCLNTDLLYEIFDYLSFTHVYKAFFNLQKCLNNAIQAYPACINLSKNIDRTAIEQQLFSCRSLIVLHIEQIDTFYLNFQSIRAIEIRSVNYHLLEKLLEKLPLEQLESLIIENIYGETNKSSDIIYQIWSMIAIASQCKLRCLEIPFEIIRSNMKELMVIDLFNLQRVILRYITASEMLIFTEHTPNLRFFTARIYNFDIDSDSFYFHHSNLIYLCLNIENFYSFNELYQLFAPYSCLKHLVLRFWITENNSSMINAEKWQLFIEQCLPHLIDLKIRLCRFVQYNGDLINLQEIFDLSQYWQTRKPLFDIKYIEV